MVGPSENNYCAVLSVRLSFLFNFLQMFEGPRHRGANSNFSSNKAGNVEGQHRVGDFKKGFCFLNASEKQLFDIRELSNPGLLNLRTGFKGL